MHGGRTVAVWAALAVLLLAACGDGGSDDGSAGNGEGSSAAGDDGSERASDGGDTGASCREAHEALATAWESVASGANEPGGDDDPNFFVGEALSACDSSEEWRTAAEATGSVPAPLATLTGLRFRCDDDPAIFSACGDLTSPEEPTHGLEGVDATGVGVICGRAVDAVEEWMHRADRPAFEEDVTAVVDAYELAAGSDRVSLPSEIEEPAGRVARHAVDDPAWAEAFDDLVAVCNAIGEGGGSF